MINNKAYRHKDKPVFMHPARPICKRWNEKSCQQHMYLFTGKYIAENAVHGNRACNCDERIKDNIHIIVAKTQHIYQRKKFDEHVAFKVIPPRIFRGEEIPISVFVTTIKKI